jgi:hypothetical protein
LAEFEKYSDYKDISNLLKHYARANRSGIYRNENVNVEKSSLDYNLAPDRGSYKQVLQYLMEKQEEISPRQRKDGVRMLDWVVTMPTTIPSSREEDFFLATYAFLVERYGRKSGMGEGVVLSAYVHKDETQSHLHFSFMPVIERDGKKAFCAKELINRDELNSFHPDLEKYLVERGICNQGDICTGITKAQGGNRSVHQLKREYARDRIDREKTKKASREIEAREKASIQREEFLISREKEIKEREDSVQQREESLERKQNERETSRWDRNNTIDRDGGSRW